MSTSNGDHPATTASDEEVFHLLNALWERADPAPPDLVDQMVAIVAADHLAQEYEMLTLVAANSPELLGARGSYLTLIEFSGRGFHVMLRISQASPTAPQRRIDGWLAPAVGGTVALDGVAAHTAELTPGGRFAFDGVTPGLVTLRFALSDGGRHETPQFSL